MTARDDIRFLLEQLSTIEHAQDRDAIAALAARHGFEFPLFPEPKSRTVVTDTDFNKMAQLVRAVIEDFTQPKLDTLVAFINGKSTLSDFDEEAKHFSRIFYRMPFSERAAYDIADPAVLRELGLPNATLVVLFQIIAVFKLPMDTTKTVGWDDLTARTKRVVSLGQ